jgi:hypothetical protein
VVALLHFALLHFALLHFALLHFALLHFALLHFALLHFALLHVVRWRSGHIGVHSTACIRRNPCRWSYTSTRKAGSVGWLLKARQRRMSR